MKKIDLSAWQTAFRQLPEEITAAEVCCEVREELMVAVNSSEIADGSFFEESNLYVKVNAEHSGIACTQQLSCDPAELIQAAYENSRYLNDRSPEPIQSGEPHFHTEEYSGGKEEMLALGKSIEQAALELCGVKNVIRCEIRRVCRCLYVMNSLGLERYHENLYYTADLTLELNGINHRSRNGRYFCCKKNLADICASEIAAQALAFGNRLDGGDLAEGKISTGTYPALLSASVAETLLYVLWKDFSGPFMEEGSSIFSGKTGKRIASDCITVIDTPYTDLCAYDLSLDYQGSIQPAHTVVDSGILQSPLYSLTDAVLYNKENTGNAGRNSIFCETQPRILYISPSTSSEDELKAKLKDGLYITYISDEIHSVNIRSGDFSTPCGGVYYKSGKPLFALSQLTMVGNIKDLFMNITEVGSDLYFDEFDLADTYYCGAPTLLLKKLFISC